MPKAIVGMLAVLAVAGGGGAFHFFTQSADLASRLEVSEAERAKLAADLEGIQKESGQLVKATGRLDGIARELSDTKDKLASYERLIESKQDELVAVMGELESLEVQLRERQAEVVPAESEPSGAEPEAEAMVESEPSTAEPAADTAAEGEPSVAELAPEVLAEAEAGATEPAPEAMTEAEAGAAEPAPEAMTEAETGAGELEAETEPDAGPSAGELEPDTMAEAETGAGEPEFETVATAGHSAAEPESTVDAADLTGEARLAEAKKRFQIVDGNGDGKVDQFEFRLNSIKLLGLIDKNDDGFVTIEETLLSPEQFKLFDLDGDGKISTTEFTRAFSTVDSEGKGYVTLEEYLEYVQATAS